MGYCSNNWISDYNYSAVMSYRAASPFTAATALGNQQARPGLLVWGRMENGHLVLEPAFEVVAPPSLPARGGRNHVQAFGPLGEPLFDLAFDGEKVADQPGAGAEHFAFIVPMDAMRGIPATRLRLSTGTQRTELLAASPTSASNDQPMAQRTGAGAVRLTWKNSATRGILVRDRRSGQILSFARGGEATVYSNESELELTISDGVRSVRQRVSVSPPDAQPRR